MLYVALSEYINAAVRLTQEQKDSHASDEAGRLYAKLKRDGFICVLLPNGYKEDTVRGAAEALRRRGATVTYRRLNWFERTHLTPRFFGLHNNAIYMESKHRWRVCVKPVKPHCVGMPRGSSSRRSRAA